ncbi:MAG: response regulator [Candidatus Paceibacterota bacterium]
MNKKILIIEDEPDIREAMAEAIAEAGFLVETAENGEIGLKKALEIKPDLILLDIIMPIMDGHETLTRLREDHWGQKAKVIILTAMDDVKNVASAHQGGIVDYIIKAHSSLEDIVKKVKLNILTD